MGGVPSAESRKNADASVNIDELFRKFVDPRRAFEQAFAEDPEAIHEIERIIDEMEQFGNSLKEKQRQQEALDLRKKLAKLQELADEGNAQAAAVVHRIRQAVQAETERDMLEKKAMRQGSRAAEDWLRKQVPVTTEVPVAETTDVDDATAASLKMRQDEQRAAEEAWRRAQKREANAREALMAHASEIAQIRFDDSILEAQRAKLRLEGLQSLTKPQQPPTPCCGEAEEMPEEPPVLEAESPKKAKTTKKRKADIPLPEYYRVLEVAVDATFEEIKKAYRKQALLWHPDKNRSRQLEATERFKAINLAFDILYDPQKREKYDSGQIVLPNQRTKKLQGHGWSSVSDEDDSVLTPLGLKYKKNSWNGYVFYGGRIDDDENDLILDESDPRYPQQRIKIFWRQLAEQLHKLNEEKEADRTSSFVAAVWKDTPQRWPKSAELQSMNEVSQQEWKERRMVYTRRKEKLRVHLDMYLAYLAIPGRAKKEGERMKRMGLGAMGQMGGPGLYTLDYIK